MTDYIIHPISAIPVYHIEDTGFRLTKDVLTILENLPSDQTQSDLVSLSNDTNVLRLNYLKEVDKLCKYHLNSYIKDICGYSEEFIITNSWVTIHKKSSAGHYPHTHPNSIFSGCVYLDTGSEESSINFHTKSRLSVDFKFDYKVIKDTLYNCKVVSISVQTGSLLIFPSNLEHSVSPHTSDGTRIALCFNTFVRSKFENNLYAADLDLSNTRCGNESDDINFKYE